MRPKDRPDAVDCDGVHVVPPRAGDDHLLIHRNERRGLKGSISFEAAELDRCVALLAERGAAPETEASSPIRIQLQRKAKKYAPTDLAQRCRHDAEVGHRRLHVLLHSGRSLRIGAPAQLMLEILYQLVV